jgi:hypothetical protein
MAGGITKDIVTAEVLDVIVNTSHPEYKDRDDIGKVYANIMSGTGQSSASAKWFKPLSTTVHTFPLIGELVSMVRSASIRSQSRSRIMVYYWFDIVAVEGNRNNNALENSTFYSSEFENTKKGDTFEEEDLPHIESFEGDTIMQGRFNNCIRFGSSVPTSKVSNMWSMGTKAGDPILILSNDMADVTEDPNNDGSSIMMTSTQKLDIKLANKEAPATVAVPTGPILPHLPPLNMYMNKPQIVISSDRLIFNAKGDSVFIAAKNNISLSTKSWKLDVTALADILLETLTQLTMETHATPCGPTSPPINAVVYGLLKTQLSAMKQ